MIISKKRITKALISLRGCAGWSAPSLFAYPPAKTGFLVMRPNFVISLYLHQYFVHASSEGSGEIAHISSDHSLMH